ncbi:copper amine oxidase N-terminal domain-containing protein [Paenibacillus alkalitolerans]|uniref:copper amine oxidase N-terminal domain-containing protein n=1 Tax=Paenibacillus alkalitolerans TaxID=2799335 RepID=UPI0018F5FD81|nr:copper amine oxidase N-terminal domain-containing protein [Paenibacillus alkalitolerans]
MKRRLLTALVAVIGMTVFSGPGIDAAPATVNINVIMDGKRLKFPDAKPFVDSNNRTLVPVRFVAENLGAKVAWHDEVDRVEISMDGKYIALVIGEKKALVNGEEVAFDTAAVVRQGRTFVPLRFVSEALGQTVEWDGYSKYVYVGEKVFLTPKEMEIQSKSVDHFRKYFGSENYKKYLTTDVMGKFFEKDEPYTKLYVITKEHLPIQIGDVVVHDIWKGQKVFFIKNSGAIGETALLTGDQYEPRLRSSVFGKDVKLPDGNLEQQYAIVTPRDNTGGGDKNYKAFTLDKVVYVGFFHVGEYIVLMENPF